MAVLTRADLQDLSRIRLVDARFLLKAGRHSAAYYLTGISVECAIKACIARQTKKYEFPQKEKTNQSYSHDLTQLLRVAGLQLGLDAAGRADATFARYWTVVKDWNIDSRYTIVAPQLASDIYVAAADRRHGVMRWLRQHW